jgi:hypothetical protein
MRHHLGNKQKAGLTYGDTRSSSFDQEEGASPYPGDRCPRFRRSGLLARALRTDGATPGFGEEPIADGNATESRHFPFIVQSPLCVALAVARPEPASSRTALRKRRSCRGCSRLRSIALLRHMVPAARLEAEEKQTYAQMRWLMSLFDFSQF